MAGFIGPFLVNFIKCDILNCYRLFGSPKNIKFHVLFILLGHAPINLKVGKRTAKLCLMNA